MKKAFITTVLLFLFVTLMGQEGAKPGTYKIGKWDLQLVSRDKFYPVYLADPLGIKFEILSKKILFSNIDTQDGLSNGEGYLGKLTIKPASRLSLLRWSPGNDPKLGVELDFGFALPLTMRQRNHDLMVFQGIYYMSIAGAPSEWLSLRIAKHHICTHRAVEFWAGSVVSPIDMDPNMYTLYVRDDVVFSAAAKPLYFLGNPELDILRVYADISAYIPGSGVIGIRQNRPNTESYFYFQGGAEVEYYLNNTAFGGFFAAVNISAWQENNYSPNYSLVAGYIVPQKPGRNRFRIGLQYYNGRCINFELLKSSERFVAFHLAFDF